MCFPLHLDERSNIHFKEFLQLNCLNVHEKYLQLIVPDIYKFENNQCHDYFIKFFCPVESNHCLG